MRIYNRLMINISTGEVIEENSYEYSGPIMLCKKGGSSGGSNIDYAYNARMAAIAEEQQAQATEYMDYWRSSVKPYEMAKIDANMTLMPFEVAATKETLKGIAELAPIETRMRKSFLESEIDLIPKRHDVSSAFYEEALSGIDVKGRMNTASADIAQSLSGSEAAARREAARMGLNPTSGRFADMLKTSSLDRAKATGFARTSARTTAEQEQFGRLATAEQLIGSERNAMRTAG